MNILRLTAIAVAAVVGGTMGCASACGGTNLNANTTAPLGMTCGAGTYLNNNQCVPIPTQAPAPAPAAARTITN
ncbi:MAG: hypothetical protein ACHQ49_04210 [Elusimicrobiota bacterium]